MEKEKTQTSYANRIETLSNIDAGEPGAVRISIAIELPLNYILMNST